MKQIISKTPKYVMYGIPIIEMKRPIRWYKLWHWYLNNAWYFVATFGGAVVVMLLERWYYAV